jgi:hypothetical protein
MHRQGGEDQGVSNIGKTYEVRGWVRTVRDQKTFAFVDINDGSTLAGLQAVLQVFPSRTSHPHRIASPPWRCCRPLTLLLPHNALCCHLRAASVRPPLHHTACGAACKTVHAPTNPHDLLHEHRWRRNSQAVGRSDGGGGSPPVRMPHGPLTTQSQRH